MDPTNSCSLMHNNRLQHLITAIHQTDMKTVRSIVVSRFYSLTLGAYNSRLVNETRT